MCLDTAAGESQPVHRLSLAGRQTRPHTKDSRGALACKGIPHCVRVRRVRVRLGMLEGRLAGPGTLSSRDGAILGQGFCVPIVHDPNYRSCWVGRWTDTPSPPTADPTTIDWPHSELACREAPVGKRNDDAHRPAGFSVSRHPRTDSQSLVLGLLVVFP